MYAERKEVTTGQEVMDELNLAINNRLEGIVLKDPTSVYKPNARKGGWYKIRPEVNYSLWSSLTFSECDHFQNTCMITLCKVR
jgi:ATP-dependent DNA ligase